MFKEYRASNSVEAEYTLTNCIRKITNRRFGISKMASIKEFLTCTRIDMRLRLSMGSFMLFSALYFAVLIILTFLLFHRARLNLFFEAMRDDGDPLSFDPLVPDHVYRNASVIRPMSTHAGNYRNVSNDRIVHDKEHSDSRVQREIKSNSLVNDNVSMLAAAHKIVARAAMPHLNSSYVQNHSVTHSTRIIKIGLYYIHHGGLTFQARQVQMKSCEYKNCKIFLNTHSEKLPFDEDAILLQGNNIPGKLPVHRNTDQAFVFLNVESPQHSKYNDLKERKFSKFFNWTMTYRLDSDIVFPYGLIASHKKTNESTNYDVLRYQTSFREQSMDGDHMTHQQFRDKDYDAIYAKKSKTMAWIVSHCETPSKREAYVNRMKSIAHIDVFGNCAKRTCARKDPECAEKVVTEYKFYLAFENSLCKDYITEKVYKWFKRDIILVVRGATNYMDHLPNGTYVDAADFESAEKLTEYLLKLGSNKSEYVRMLKAKDSYGMVGRLANSQAAYCHLCKMLNHVDKYRKSIENIDDWWTRGICARPVIY